MPVNKAHTSLATNLFFIILSIFIYNYKAKSSKLGRNAIFPQIPGILIPWQTGALHLVSLMLPSFHLMIMVSQDKRRDVTNLPWAGSFPPMRGMVSLFAWVLLISSTAINFDPFICKRLKLADPRASAATLSPPLPLDLGYYLAGFLQLSACYYKSILNPNPYLEVQPYRGMRVRFQDAHLVGIAWQSAENGNFFPIPGPLIFSSRES